MASAIAGVLQIVGKKVMEAKKAYDALKRELETLEKTVTALNELCSDRQKLESISESGIQTQLVNEVHTTEELLDEILEIQHDSKCGPCLLGAAALVGKGAAAYNKKIAAQKERLQEILDIASEQVNVAQLAALEDMAGGVPGKVINHPGAKKHWLKNFGTERKVTSGEFHESVDNEFHTDMVRTFQDMRTDLKRALMGQLDPSQDGSIEATEFAQFVENSGAGGSRQVDLFDLVSRSACTGSLSGAMTVGHGSKIRSIAVHENFIATADEQGFVKLSMYQNGAIFPLMNSAVGAVQDPVTFLKITFDPVNSMRVFAASRNVIELSAFTGTMLSPPVREPHVSQVVNIDVEGPYIFTVGKYPSRAAHVWRRNADGEWGKFGAIGGKEQVFICQVLGNGRHCVVMTESGLQVWDYTHFKLSHRIQVPGEKFSSFSVERCPEEGVAGRLICGTRRGMKAFEFAKPDDKEACEAPTRSFELPLLNSDFPRAHFTASSMIQMDKDKLSWGQLANGDAKFQKQEMTLSQSAKMNRVMTGNQIGVACFFMEQPGRQPRGGYVVVDQTSHVREGEKKESTIVPTLMATFGAWAMHSLPASNTSIAMPWCLSKHHMVPVGKFLISSCKSSTVHIFNDVNNIGARVNLALERGRKDVRRAFERVNRRKSRVSDPADVDPLLATSEEPLICDGTIASACAHIERDGSTAILYGFSDGLVVKHNFPKLADKLVFEGSRVCTPAEQGLHDEDQFDDVISDKFFGDVQGACWLDENAAFLIQSDLDAFGEAVVTTVLMGDAQYAGRSMIMHIEELYNALTRQQRNCLPEFSRLISQNREMRSSPALIEETCELLIKYFSVADIDQEEAEAAEKAEKDVKLSEKAKKQEKEKAETEKEKKRKQVREKKAKKLEGRENAKLFREVVIHRSDIKWRVEFSGKIPYADLGGSEAGAIEDPTLLRYSHYDAWQRPSAFVRVSGGQYKCPDCPLDDKQLLGPMEHIWGICRRCARKRAEADAGTATGGSVQTIDCIQCGKSMVPPRDIEYMTADEFDPKTKKVTKEGEKRTQPREPWPMCNRCYDKKKSDIQQMVICVGSIPGTIVIGSVAEKHKIWDGGRGDIVQLHPETLKVTQRLSGMYTQGYRNIIGTSEEGGMLAFGMNPGTVCITGPCEDPVTGEMLPLTDGIIARIATGGQPLVMCWGKSADARPGGRDVHDREALLFWDKDKTKVCVSAIVPNTDRTAAKVMKPLAVRADGDKPGSFHTIDIGSVVTSMVYGKILSTNTMFLACGSESGQVTIFVNVETNDYSRTMALQMHRFDIISGLHITTSDELITACNNGTFGRIPVDLLKTENKSDGKKKTSNAFLLVDHPKAANGFTYLDSAWKIVGNDGKGGKALVDGKSREVENNAFKKIEAGEPVTICLNRAVAELSVAPGRKGRYTMRRKDCDDTPFNVRLAARRYGYTRKGTGDSVTFELDEKKVEKPVQVTINGGEIEQVQFLKEEDDLDGKLVIVRLTPFSVSGRCRLRIKPKGGDASATVTAAVDAKGLEPSFFELKNPVGGPMEVSLEVAPGQRPENVSVTFMALSNHKDGDLAEELKPACFVIPPPLQTKEQKKDADATTAMGGNSSFGGSTSGLEMQVSMVHPDALTETIPGAPQEEAKPAQVSPSQKDLSPPK